MKDRFFFILILFLIGISSCKEETEKIIDIVSETPKKLPARTAYERSYSVNDSDFLRWREAFENAKLDKLQITLPYSESGIFNADLKDTIQQNFNVYSYNLQLKEGERIVVDVEKQTDSILVFIDFFQVKDGSLELLKSAENRESYISQEIEKSSFYKIIVQPQMNLEIPFKLKIYKEPLYTFPIIGGENKDIQGFWADPRDTGSRSHEGVDIFAARGTPVISVSNGVVSTIGEGGFGGKQVWLSDDLFGNRIYYAHLDSIAVSEGNKLKIGDTIGFVGNTGNAIDLPPHLHFGVYKDRTAVNPLPYIKKTEIQNIKIASTVVKAVVANSRAEIRKGPASFYEQLGILKKNDTLFVLGKNQTWFHIQSLKGVKGFISERAVTPISSN